MSCSTNSIRNDNRQVALKRNATAQNCKCQPFRRSVIARIGWKQRAGPLIAQVAGVQTRTFSHLVIVLVFLGLVAAPSPVAAAPGLPITLAWDRNTESNLAGYKILRWDGEHVLQPGLHARRSNKLCLFQRYGWPAVLLCCIGLRRRRC